MNSADKSFLTSLFNQMKEEIISELKGVKRSNIKSEKQYRIRKDIMGINKIKKSDIV